MWRRRKSHTHEYTQARENPFDPSLCTNVAPPPRMYDGPGKREEEEEEEEKKTASLLPT